MQISSVLLDHCIRHVGARTPRLCRARFAKSTISYYANADATFNYDYLCLCGDIISNPTCPVCDKRVAKSHRAISCDGCSLWCHIKCGGVSPKEYKMFQATKHFSWTCPTCIAMLHELPFANVSNIDSSLDCSSFTEHETCILPGYHDVAHHPLGMASTLCTHTTISLY